MPDNTIGNLMDAAKNKAKNELINNSAIGASSATGTNSAASNYTGEVFTDKSGKKYTRHSILGGIVQFAQVTCVAGGPWWDCVVQMGSWYQQNIHLYQGTTEKPRKGKCWTPCTLLNGKEVADDCSGFVQACLRLAGIDCPSITTSDMNKEKFQTMMQEAGFQHLTGNFTPENSQPGDILCGGPQTHTEIYAGDCKSYSWGNIHDGQNGHQGMPCSFCSINDRGGYIHCWRKIG